MRKLTLIIGMTLCVSLFTHAAQPIPVNTQILKKIAPSTTFFNGKVSPVKTGKFGILTPGTLAYTASPGDIVYSQIKDQDGKIVRPGTPIIILDKTLPKLTVETARINLLKAKRAQLNKENEYKRYYNLNLKQKNIISQRKIEEAKASYDTNLLNVKNSEFELSKAETNLKRCTIYPKFTGQVDEVYYASGTALDKFKDVVKITMMNPMAIDLTLPLALVNNLGIENEIQVFDAGSKKPVKALLSKNPINPTDLNLIVTNELISSKELTPEQKKLPVIHKALFVVNAYIPKKSFISGKKTVIPPLAVPVSSIKQDKKGFYVWKAVNQNPLLKNKPLCTQFKIEKVYIKPGKIFRYVSFIKGYGNHFHSIEKTDKISKGDMLILDAEDDLKDGAEVVYQQLHWRFTVNEKVKITISGLNKPGFYVPFTAIFNQYLGTPQICIVRNGKAVFADIKQNGLHGEYIRIESDSIKEGDQVVLDSNNALQNVYEGAELKVLKAMEAPIKLNHNVAKAYNPVTAPIQSVKVVE